MTLIPQLACNESGGAEVFQITDDPYPKSNIYCEECYCSADSRSFVFTRSVDDPRNPIEIVQCEFGSWDMRPIGRCLSRPTMTHRGLLYCVRRQPDGAQQIVRHDLDRGTEAPLFEFDRDHPANGRGSMSIDERYYACGVVLGYAPQLFGVEAADLASGEIRMVATDPEIWNPHTHFEPSEGRLIAVQHNRGCRFAPDGTRLARSDQRGVTLFTVDVTDGRRTPLWIGPPYTASTTGHEAWIGATKSLLVSTHYRPERGGQCDNLFIVAAGALPRHVPTGLHATHVHVTPCGRYFAIDETPEKRIVVGSLQTGRNAVLCRSDASYGAGQPSHAHPWLSRDLKWVVFNSDRTGRTEIHVASVPEGLLKRLDR